MSCLSCEIRVYEQENIFPKSSLLFKAFYILQAGIVKITADLQLILGISWDRTFWTCVRLCEFVQILLLLHSTRLKVTAAQRTAGDDCNYQQLKQVTHSEHSTSLHSQHTRKKGLSSRLASTVFTTNGCSYKFLCEIFQMKLWLTKQADAVTWLPATHDSATDSWLDGAVFQRCHKPCVKTSGCKWWSPSNYLNCRCWQISPFRQAHWNLPRSLVCSLTAFILNNAHAQGKSDFGTDVGLVASIRSRVKMYESKYGNHKLNNSFLIG